MAPWPLTQTKAIHKAVASGDVIRLKRLLASKGTDVNTKNASGATALHIAICRQNREAVEALLAQDGIEPNAQDLNGKTALHVAVSIPVLFAVEALLNHKRILVNLPDNDGRSPLHYAVNASLAEPKNPALALLLKKPEISIEARDQRQRTPLSWALHLGLADTVKALIQNRDFARAVAVRDGERNTALHKAVRCPGTISLLVRGLDRTVLDAVLDAKNNMSETALHVAARFNAFDCIEPLVKAGADPILGRDSDGATPFHVAVYNCSYAFVDCLTGTDPALRNRDVILATDNAGNTPLHRAAERGDSKMVDLILRVYEAIARERENRAGGPDPVQVAQANHKDEAAADLAASHGHADVAIRLLEEGSIEPGAARSRRREAAFKIISKLFDTHAAASEHEKKLERLLLWAARYGMLDVLKKLQQHAKPSMLEHPLVSAAAEGHLDMVQHLIRARVDPNARGGRPPETPLAAAAKRGHIEIMRFLLGLDQVDPNQGAVFHGPGESIKDTTLMCAIRAHSTAAVSLLLSDESPQGSSLDLNMGDSGYGAAGYWMWNPLLLTCTLGYEDIAKMLIRRAYVEGKRLTLDVRGNDDDGPLSLACKGGHCGVVKLLMDTRSWKFGLDRPCFEHKGASGRTPFSYACSSPSAETVALFLNSDLINGQLVDPDSADPMGRTPFAYACKEGQPETVDLILKSGLIERKLVKPDSRDRAEMAPFAQACGMTPFAHACKEGRAETVAVLLKSGLIERGLINLNSADEKGMTPLAHACREGEVDIVRDILDSTLLKDGLVDVNARDKRGRSPLAHACERGQWKIIRLFLDRFLPDNSLAADIFGAVDESGNTLLQMACHFNGSDEDLFETILTLLDSRLLERELVRPGHASSRMVQRVESRYKYTDLRGLEESPMWPGLRRMAELGCPLRVSLNPYEDERVLWCGFRP